ncbi:MAG: hypothetical protein HC888_14575 [Candidatus Competibacteraceae bacterium]|nr:hypothetical protein [Candidatus Competibacteraceae bacterium]
MFAVPLCLFCSVLILGFEWLNGAVERCCYTVANGGFTDKELRTFSDSGEVIFEGSIDNKRLRLIEWSVGAFSGFRYRLLLTEEKGPYCYKVIRYVELPYGCNPTLIVLKDGSYELQITNRSGVEVFRRDVREVLNGTGVVTE